MQYSLALASHENRGLSPITHQLLTQPMQLAVLSEQEMKETEGAWWPWLGFGAAGGIGNTYGYISSNSNWSWGGAAYAFGTGFSGALVASLPGTTAYRLGYTALGGGMAATSYGW